MEWKKIEPFLFQNTHLDSFLNNNLFTQKLTKPAKEERFTIDSTEFKKIENIKPQYYSLTEILSKAKSDEIENICVYTETINEARDIFEDYDEWKEKVIYYDYRKIDSLKLDDTSKMNQSHWTFIFMVLQLLFIP